MARNIAGQRGQVLSELAIVFPVVLATLCVIVQIALDQNARGLTEFAAYNAARSAIVQIPRDYGGDDPYVVTQGGRKWTEIRKAAVFTVMSSAKKDSSGTGYAKAHAPELTRLSRVNMDAGPYLARYRDADKHTTITFQRWDGRRWVNLQKSGGRYVFDGGDQDVTVLVTFDHYEVFPMKGLFYLFHKNSLPRYATITARCTLPLEGETARIRGY